MTPAQASASSPPPPPPPQTAPLETPATSSNPHSATSSQPPPASNVDQSVNMTPPVPVVPTGFEHPNDPPETHTTLPSPNQARQPSQYAHPPFDTHRFFSALEKTFPTPTARSLMRATRALLVDRIGRVRRDALTIKDLESVRPFLFLLVHLM